jgi:simple sugar transport system permease protein
MSQGDFPGGDSGVAEPSELEAGGLSPGITTAAKRPAVESSPTAGQPDSVRPPRHVRFLRFLVRPEATPLAGLVITVVVFTILAPSLFLTKETAITVASDSSELGIAAIAVTLLMISGNFDLSVGSITAISGYAALLSVQHGLGAGGAIVVALFSGIVIGLINGVLVVVTKIHSFVVTLGTMLILYSVLDLAVQGVTTTLGMNPHVENAIAGSNLDGFQMSLIYFVVLTALATIFLLRTKAGNWTYAMGQNRAAAENLGVPTKLMTIALFAVSGFGGALVGLIQAARFDTVDPGAGLDLELYVIAVIVIGGASLFGGYGSAIGTFLGAIIYGMIEVGIVLAGAPGYLFNGLVGVGLFVAVLINEFTLRKVGAMGAQQPQRRYSALFRRLVR